MIEIQGLYKYYGKRRAVGPIDLTIEDGTVVGLLGLNGAGKSTTMRMLACDLLPSSGTIRVAGFDVVREPDEVRKRVGYLPDTPPLYPELRVGEFLRFVAQLRGVPKDAIERRVKDAEERTGTAEVDGQLIGTLSHGYRQRVGIAQAIVHDPPFILLDEPIAGLDPGQIVSTRKMIRALGGDHTVLLSSHILSEITDTCDRLLVIRDGQIVASGTESELFASVGERSQVHVQVRASSEEQLAELESLLEGVEGVQAVEAAEWLADEKLADIRLEMKGDHRPEIARRLVEKQFDLVTLSRAERELENVFLQIASTSEEGASPRAKGSTNNDTKQQGKASSDDTGEEER